MAAIYDFEWTLELHFTTTLYPVVVIESVTVSCSAVGGWLALTPSDSMETTHTVLDMTYVQTRWFMEDGPYEDSWETSHTVIDMTYIQTRWFLEDGPYDDSWETTHIVLDMTYIRVKVEADTPDESVQMAIAIMNTCTMSAV